MAELPPYEFCTIIPEIHPASGGNKEICCVQAMGGNIYLGCQDGTLLRYALEESADGTVHYELASQYNLPTKTKIESIQLAPSASKAVVLSNDNILFFSLPTLEPVPPEVIRPMKNALGFVLNETPGDREPAGIAVIKRAAVAFWELGSKLNYIKELNVPVLAARRAGPTLCVADTENYNVIDLRNSSMTPIHPISLSPTWKIIPQIVVSKHDEYLVVVCNGTSDDFSQVYSIGLFVNGRGDPTQAPLEWGSLPSSICVDGELVISLHAEPGQTPTVEVRMMNATGLQQSFSLPSTKVQGEMKLLSLARSGFSAPLNARQERLTMKRIVLFEARTTQRNGKRSDKNEDGEFGEPEGSGLTPPPTPKPQKSSHQHSRSLSRGRPRTTTSTGPSESTLASLPTSNILLATPHAVYGLIPSTLFSQVEALLEDGKLKEASSLLSQAQSKQAKDGVLAAEFRYLNLRVGLCYLQQTSFDDAGDALFRGDMDPRWIIGLWEDWRDTAVRASEDADAPVMLDVFSGLEPHINALRGMTIRQIISRSLVSNYSPHLKPSTELSSTGQELKMTLEWSARIMLEKYLRKFRNRRRFIAEEVGGVYADPKVNKAVDTVSALLYAQSENAEDMQELRMLLDESPSIMFEDIRSSLVKNGHIEMLLRIYERRGDQGALLDLYVQLAEGTLVDQSVADPVSRIAEILRASKDRGLVQQRALWLLGRDRETGLRLLIGNDNDGSGSKSEDVSLLTQIQEIDDDAGLSFLEYLVLQKQTRDKTLHTQLALSYIKALVKDLADTKQLNRTKTVMENYVTSTLHVSTPFLSYLAFETPGSDHKTMHLKLCFLLQGSSMYSLDDVRGALLSHGAQIEKAFALERAILDSKAGDHKSALSTIVKEFQDFTTAEAYCSLGGRVITPKIAVAIGDRLQLKDWAALVLSADVTGSLVHGYAGRLRTTGSSGSIGSRSPQSETPKEGITAPNESKAVELTRMLLEVYMGAGERKAVEASKLLNAQAINLDAQEIVPLMPSSWSLDLVSSFLARSFRRSLHHQYEGQILKQLSTGQNLQTSEYALEAFAAAGALIEESGSVDEEGNVEDRRAEDEAGLEEDAQIQSPNEKSLDIPSGMNGLEELASRIAKEKLG